MSMRTAIFCLAAVLAAVPIVHAHPTEHSLEARTVWAPKVVAPDAHTVWKVGAKETVRW